MGRASKDGRGHGVATERFHLKACRSEPMQREDERAGALLTIDLDAIAENYRRMKAGRPLANVVDLERGY